MSVLNRTSEPPTPYTHDLQEDWMLCQRLEFVPRRCQGGAKGNINIADRKTTL